VGPQLINVRISETSHQITTFLAAFSRLNRLNFDNSGAIIPETMQSDIGTTPSDSQLDMILSMSVDYPRILKWLTTNFTVVLIEIFRMSFIDGSSSIRPATKISP
jgi:hypothetical protein